MGLPTTNHRNCTHYRPTTQQVCEHNNNQVPLPSHAKATSQGKRGQRSRDNKARQQQTAVGSQWAVHSGAVGRSVARLFVVAASLGFLYALTRFF